MTPWGRRSALRARKSAAGVAPRLRPERGQSRAEVKKALDTALLVCCNKGMKTQTAPSKDAAQAERHDAIDVTPSWAEWGAVYRSFAESGEKAAVRQLREDFARAMAAADAFRALKGTLTDEQAAIAAKTVVAQATKQGY